MTTPFRRLITLPLDEPRPGHAPPGRAVKITAATDEQDLTAQRDALAALGVPRSGSTSITG
jgi:hypothetical protein